MNEERTRHDLPAAQTDLRQLNETLEQRVAERTKWLTLMHDITRAINDAASWDEGLHAVLSRICELGRWQMGYIYLPDRDDPAAIVPVIGCCDGERFGAFHRSSMGRRYPRGQSLPGRVFTDGVPLWIDGSESLEAMVPYRRRACREAGLVAGAALPVRFGREVIAVLELFTDRPHDADEVLENLMADVCAQIGKVLERERSAAQVADFVWREQQELLHTLHDSLGQTLTGLGMLSSGLSQRLTDGDQASAEMSRQIARQAQVALDQVRQLSRGLFPVEVDAESLLPALRDLAATTETFHGLRVEVDGEVPGQVHDSRVATQLYRIAQEAVTNAVKHARATSVRIELGAEPGLMTLSVTDNGGGLDEAARERGGLGLRIMRYRATSIGAQLRIESRPGAGTVVSCALRDSPSGRGFVRAGWGGDGA